MKLLLLNTSSGLKPLYDEDYEEKQKLKIGKTYQASINQVRNYEFHKKYFAFLRCAWEYLTPAQRDFLKSRESFRKTVQIAAGYSEPVFNITKKEWQENAISISFDNMDELEFKELYENVRAVVFNVFLKHVSLSDFEKELINF